MIDEYAGSPHWSFWVISVVGLLFNLMGGMNFISQMNPELVSTMSETYRALVESRPIWATGAFAIAVFGGALGTILLLLRNSVAYYVFIASLIGAATAQIPVLGIAHLPIAVVIGGMSQLAAALFLIWYSKYANQKGWLR